MSPSYAQPKAKQILFVDDNAIVRESCAKLLRSLGYAVATAQDGEAGWIELGRSHYDLLITDEQMPRLCGTELIERLQTAGTLPPTIIVTAMTEPEIAEKSPRAAAAVSGYVPKPFYPVELTGAVYQALHVARAPAEPPARPGRWTRVA